MSSIADAKAAIYERLNSVPTYHPSNADLFTDWTLESGDIITVMSGNTEYTLPVFGMNLKWNGSSKVSVASTGDQHRASIEEMAQREAARRGHSYRSGLARVKQEQVIRQDIYSEDGYLHSVIEQSASHIMTAVEDVRSGLYSFIEQTPGMIHSEVGEAVSGFAHSVIEQTASYIRTEVSGAASAISQTVIEQTEEYIQTTVTSVASGIAWSVVTQTMTGIIQEVGRKAQIFVQPTDPTLTETVYEKDLWIKTTGVTNWSQLGQESWSSRSAYQWRQYYGGKLYVRKNNTWQEVIDSSTMVEQSTKIEQDDEHIALLAQKTDAQGEDYKARLQVTAQEIRGEVSTAQSKIYSVVYQTATNVFSGVYDEVADNFSTIEQTATSIALSVNSAKSALSSTIVMTSTSIFSAVYNKVSDNFSTITQTSTSIALAVAAGKSAVYNSVIAVTSTQISLKVSKGSVISSINQSAEEITIQASKINLNGYVKTTDMTATNLSGWMANFSTLSSERGGISVYSVGTTNFSQGGVACYFPSAIRDISLSQSGNTYTLKKRTYSSYDANPQTWTDIGSFSRAVTDWSYSWSGGQLTVTALPQNNSKAITGVKTTGSWSGNTYNGRVVYWDGTDDDGTTYNTGATFSVSRAVTGINYAWSNGQLTAFPTPQGGSYAITGVKTAGSWSSGTYNGRVVYWDGTDDDGTTWNTGATFTLSDSDLVSSNIKNGVTIFGVTGTYSGGGGGSISDDDIQIGSYNNVSTEPSGTTANLMRDTIVAAMNNHNWFRFKVYVNGTSAEKYYKFKFD